MSIKYDLDAERFVVLQCSVDRLVDCLSVLVSSENPVVKQLDALKDVHRRMAKAQYTKEAGAPRLSASDRRRSTRAG